MSDFEDEEGDISPKPPPFKRAPSFEVVIDPIDEPWEWPAKPENTEVTSEDSDDDMFGRGSAASNEEVGCFRFSEDFFIVRKLLYAQCDNFTHMEMTLPVKSCKI
jgi:hypothetical protein